MNQMGFKLLCTDVFSPPAPMVLGSDSKPHLTSRCFAILKKGEQASKQRCTFSPTTFSSVQFSSGGAMFICVLLASGSFSFLGTPNHMVQPRNGHWYSAVSSSTRSHQRGGWRNGYTLEVRATTQLRIRTSTCSRSCAAQWGSVAFGGGRGLGRGGGAKGEERGCGGRQAYREPIDFYVVFLTAFGQSVSRWWSTDRTERPHIGHCSRGCSLCFANDFLRAPPSPPALQCGQRSVCGACSTVCSAVCHQSRRTRV